MTIIFCSAKKSGDDRLRAALARRQQRARDEDPHPYDDAWGWWIEERIARLERGQLWLIRIAGAALAAEVVRIICTTLGIGA